MARLNPRPLSSDTESPNSANRHSPDTPTTPPSPGHSDSEDDQQSRSSKGKRKSTAVDGTPVRSQKRRRAAGDPSQTPSAQQYYDPEQAPEERRQVRKGLRNLISELHDSRAEYLQPNSKGLEETLRKADELYVNVKQTADATIDSGLLVEAADLSYKKISNLTLGDGSTGIDVEDFVTKCIVFMKQGDEHGRARNAPPSTQTQRRRRNGDDDDDDDDDDAGDTMNWEYLGRNACFLYNSRPCLTGFLLGPLSVQKKVRQQTQRKAREARTQPIEAVRPLRLGDEDLQKQESANLTEICTEIAHVLQVAISHNSEAAEKELQELEEIEDDVSEEQAREICRRHCIADNQGIPLFNFCVNPKSFGQSVENMFYVSFLIKEGKVGLGLDSQGLPTLGITGARSLQERQETQRNQVIFTLSFDIWEDIVNSFGIEKSIIPHRNEEKYDDGTVDFAGLEAGDDRRDEEDNEDSDAYA